MALAPAFHTSGLAAVGLALMLPATPAVAELFCSDHDAIVAGLTDSFHERRLGYGVAGDAAIVEIYISADGTWTVLLSDVRGRSCVLAAGDGWESAADEVREAEPRH
jgi:hypothetical protein